jgi:hypothetical protein
MLYHHGRQKHTPEIHCEDINGLVRGFSGRWLMKLGGGGWIRVLSCTRKLEIWLLVCFYLYTFQSLCTVLQNMLWHYSILNPTFLAVHQYMERIPVEGHRGKGCRIQVWQMKCQCDILIRCALRIFYFLFSIYTTIHIWSTTYPI